MDQFKDAIDQIDSAMDRGDIDLATRLSADLFAEYDRQWTEARNANLPTADILLRDNIAGVRHCEALLAGGHEAEAWSTLLLMLLRDAIDTSQSSQLDQVELDQLLLATKTFLSLSERINPDDSEATTHASAILTLLASRLYNQYRRLNGTGNPNLDEAYTLLMQLRDINAICYPNVAINGAEVSVDDKAAIMGDIVGRARAMGWLVCD